MSKSRHIIPIFVPHLGCPHDCVFCNQKKVTGLNTSISKQKVDEVINEYIKTIPSSNKTLEMAFFGGSFTGIKKETQKELLNVAKKYKDSGVIDYIRISTRPDYISHEILDMLKNMSVDIIELGVQSLDRDVLVKSKRGHAVEDVITATKLIRNYDFKLGLQMMVGLPGDNKVKSIKTAFKIARLNPDFVRIYPTLVIKDTLLEKNYLNLEYMPLSLADAVDLCCDILMVFRYNNIPVIRIGLQPTDNITLGQEIIDGPFHPSIRQLVEAKLYEKILDDFFCDKHLDIHEIIIKINSKEISNIVGQKSSNLDYLRNKYGIRIIKLSPTDIPKEFFYVMIDNREYKVDIDRFIKKCVTNFDYM